MSCSQKHLRRSLDVCTQCGIKSVIKQVLFAPQNSSNAGVPGAGGDRGGFVVGAAEGGGFGGVLFPIEGVVTLVMKVMNVVNLQ